MEWVAWAEKREPKGKVKLETSKPTATPYLEQFFWSFFLVKGQCNFCLVWIRGTVLWETATANALVNCTANGKKARDSPYKDSRPFLPGEVCGTKADEWKRRQQWWSWWWWSLPLHTWVSLYQVMFEHLPLLVCEGGPFPVSSLQVKKRPTVTANQRWTQGWNHKLKVCSLTTNSSVWSLADCIQNNTAWGLNRNTAKDFSGGRVVKTLDFYCRGYRFDPWSRY